MTAPDVTLRPAEPTDAPTVAAIWEQGWAYGHLGNVPDELIAARHADSFHSRAGERVADTTVAVVAGEVVGFVMFHGNEVEQFYVASGARGTGVADALMVEAERHLARVGHTIVWLAVVAGNARARRFYERR